MDNNIELLNYVYQNAEMGLVMIDDLVDKVDDIPLKTTIRSIREDYLNISKDSIQIFIKYGRKENELSKLTKISTYIVSFVKTLIDNSSSTIAKMITENSNKGIIEISMKLNSCSDVDQEIIELINDLKKLEEQNIEKLSEYL